MHVVGAFIRLLVDVIIQVWTSDYMKWNPAEYGGVSEMNIPVGKIWTPDILLYNK